MAIVVGVMSTAPHSKEFRSQGPESTTMSSHERDAAGVIHPGSSGWVQCNHEGPSNRGVDVRKEP